MKRRMRPLKWKVLSGAFLAGTLLSTRATFAASPPRITTQPLSQSVVAGSNAVFNVVASGSPSPAYQWSFNGTHLTNSTHISGATSATLTVSKVGFLDRGNYRVVASNYRDSATSSNALLTVIFTNRLHYVDLNSTNPVPPYGDWSTAATNIQNAVDIANAGDTIFVTNGVYSFGDRVIGSDTNCVAVVIPISIIGVSGAAQTWIDGGGVKRCVYLTNGASLMGFTLTNGNASSGGGAACASLNAVIANCILSGNTAGTGGAVSQGSLSNCTLSGNSGFWGGSVANSLLNNCLLTGNSGAGGGAAAYSTLNNCTLISNAYTTFSGSSTFGGGGYACTLSNCTLIGNSSSQSGGGAYASTLTGCTLIANSADGYQGGGVDSCTLYSCTLSNNFAGQWGGNASESTLYNCWLTGGTAYLGGGARTSILIGCVLSNNTAIYGQGGGANASTLTNCVLIGNVAGYTGGGADSSIVINSLILSNAAPYGGGVNGGSATNCVLMGNRANDTYVGGGGGANGGTLYNCLLTGNTSVLNAGGALQSILVNCTVAGNAAIVDGGGVDSSVLTNCLVYFNTSSVNGNFSGTNYMSWCCTAPLPAAGPGDVVIGVSNISSAPVFADAAHGNYRLYPGSPGVDAGNNSAMPLALDLDGDSRVVNGTVDLGAYEFQNFPFIEIQPASQTVPFGQPAVSFNVLAVGPGTLTYQWRFNGTDMAGETNSVLTLDFVNYDQAGTYSVSVTNSYGTMFSSNAVLTVVPPTRPTFVSQPVTNMVVPVGTNISLAVTVTGAPPPAVQWYFSTESGLPSPLADGSHYAGTTATELQVSNVQTNDTGNYFVVATNTGGATTSSVAAVTVLMPPEITSQPAGQTLAQGSSVTFSSAVSGGAPLSYQWLFNGTALANGGQFSGVTTTNLTISNLQFTNNGDYVLTVTNPVGSATSATAVLTVLSAPEITQPPADQFVLPGASVVFSSKAIGTEPISYQWHFNGVPLADDSRIAGSATSVLTVGSAETNDAGGYSVVATNLYGAVTSSVAQLTIILPVTITQSPSNQTVAVASNLVLTASAGGSAPFGYQWFFNNSPLTDSSRIGGSMTANLTISNALTSDTGNYFVAVTNLLSSATSAVAAVTVLTPPAISLQPVGRSTPLGLPTTFSAAASGDGVLTYQWQLNGTNIPGATNISYSVAAVGTNDLGIYQFVASNAVGMAVSSNAWLTAGPVAAWGLNNYGQCIVPPGLSNVTTVAGGYTYSLASRLDGSIAAWGSVGAYTNSGFTNVVALSASGNGALALRADGTVVGSVGVDPLAYKAFPSNAVAVAAGYGFGLALRAEGTVVSWGQYSPGSVYYNALAVPPGLAHVTAIAAGLQQALALRSDGTVAAWGYGSATNVPIGLSNVVAIAAGSTHSLALKSDGTVVAWGWGAGTNVPPGLSNVVAIAAGGYPDQRSSVSFAVQSNGMVVTWGLALNNQTNVPSGLSNVVAVALGSYHALALVNDGEPQILRQPVGGTAWSGGDWTLQVAAAGAAPLSYQWQFDDTNLDSATNSTLVLPAIQSSNAGNYQVIVSNSIGVATSISVPLTVMDSAPFLLTQPATNLVGWLANPFRLSAAAAGSGPLRYQWQFNGANISAATNDTLNFDRLHLADAGNYLFIASNSFGAVKSSVIHLTVQQVLVWGDGSYGQTNVPPGLTNAVAISAGLYGNIALRADGTVAVWGNGGYATNNAGVSNVVEVSAGQNAYLALESGGRPHVWGSVSLTQSNLLSAQSNIVSAIFWDSRGELLRADGTVLQSVGDGLITNNAVTNGIALENYDNNYLVLRADGTVYSSIGNLPPNLFSNVYSLGPSKSSSQIVALERDGTVTEYGLPLLSTNLSNVIGVASSGYSPLDFAVLSDGSVVWGGPPGYLPPNPATNVPAGLSSVQALDAGYRHCLALLSDRDFRPVLLPAALDTTSFVVSSQRSPQWFGETNISHDGVSAAQSAAIGNNTASSMRMWVSGAVTVKFWWKVSSSANHGILSFSAGGVVLTNISGEMDWRQCTVTVPQGNEILQWTYAKDGAPAAGQDAGWVDQLQIIPVAPAILAQPQPASQEVVGGTDVNVSYSVAAIGTPPLNYTWKKNDGTIFSGSSSNLMLTDVSRADSGTYSVEVISPYGSTISSNAVLLVHVPQLLGTPVFQPDGSIVLTTTDANGGQLSATDLTNCQVQVSTNLVDWLTLSNALVFTNGTIQLQDTSATNTPMRFYRILENW